MKTSGDTQGKAFLKTIYMKLEDILSLYLAQLIPLLVFHLVDLFRFDINSLSNVFITVFQNALFIASIFIALQCNRKTKTSAYDANQKEAIFLVQMINLICYFLLRGFRGEPNSYALAASTISLYFGFSVSLNSLINAKSPAAFASCFTKTYTSAQLKIIDWLMLLVINLGVLIITWFFM